MSRNYEDTPHKLAVPPDILSEEGQKPQYSVNIHRIDLLEQDGSAFVLRGVLSKDECQFFIDQAEELGMQDTGYSHRIRITHRVAAQSTAVADLLFERIHPFLESSVNLTSPVPDGEEDGEEDEEDEDGATNRREETQPQPTEERKKKRWPTGIPDHVRRWTWFPVGLNEVFRLCRYDPGGFFLPHHDGGFSRDEFERSLQTFMLYLNDDFEGGPTNFYNDLQLHYQPGQARKVIQSFRPQAGDALIFFSAQTHDGGIVTNGQKYIMRSEVMYSAIRQHGAAAGDDNDKSRTQKETVEIGATRAEKKFEPDHDEVDLDSFVPDGYHQ